MLRLSFLALFCFLPLLATAETLAPQPAPAAPATATASNSVPAPATPAATPVNPNPAPASTASPKITYTACHVDGPYIAMTFDDGPHATNTPRLLDMLKQRGIKATFFVVGECAAQYPAIMKRIVEEGHEIGNHSWSHPLLSSMSEANVTSQIQKTDDIIKSTTGITPKVFRPPFGGFTVNQRGWANRQWGYKIILWDVDPLDWKVRNAEHVKSEILRHTVAGSIVLSHDIHKTTVDAMPDTLDGLIGRGFKFVTVSELLAMDRPVPPKAKATPAPAKNTTAIDPANAAAPVAEAITDTTRTAVPAKRVLPVKAAK